MRKNGTSRPILRGIKLGAAVFIAMIAVWLVWLTGNPTAAADQVRKLAGDTQVASTLLTSELSMLREEGGLSAMDRLVLAQSSLLNDPLPPQEESTPSPDPSASPPPSAPEDNSGEEAPNPPPATTTAPEGIIPRTMVAGTSAKYVTSRGVSIYNHTDYTLDVDALLAAGPKLTAGEGPQILIYHSHATEAYTMDGTDIYEESDRYRTLDTDQNIVRVGTEMTAVLEAAGLEVIHDTTLYDYPSYNSAYTRSIEGVLANLEQYPSIQLVIDVHRDALEATDGTIYKTVAGTVDNCAQVMMVMGSDASGQQHPNWKVNLALAVEIQSALAGKWSTLARPIVLRTSRFNQHVSTGAILVEIGTHGNTLQEAITAGRLFARTLAELMTE